MKGGEQCIRLRPGCHAEPGSLIKVILLNPFTQYCLGIGPTACKMGQVLWRVARNQQLQHQRYSEEGYYLVEHDRRHDAVNRKQVEVGIDIYHILRVGRSKAEHGFPDLELLPPELSLTILSYLNATDLCLASCVWQDLANDDVLWQGLCKSTWGHCSIYYRVHPSGLNYRQLYMQLDEGSLTFNANPHEGIGYIFRKGILDNVPKEIAKFIFYTRTLNWKKLRIYLDDRRDVLDELVTLHNFSNQFLPNALREFFRHIHAPEERGEYLETLITKFSQRFCACNPAVSRDLGLSPEESFFIWHECCQTVVSPDVVRSLAIGCHKPFHVKEVMNGAGPLDLSASSSTFS
ncbi:F-box only protein 8 isoform X2 [Narcine bancroftii]|uniref:F-box only protein 8 isoform X2 n=1 Tax=Narcine bancroftii TaxID=1343680 RepID=UPI00383197D2